MQYLIIDDDEAFTATFARILSRRGEQVLVANDGEAALEVIRSGATDRVVLDLKLEQESGLQILVQLLAIQPTLQIVILTGYSSISTAVEAIKLGAVQYLCKPASLDEVLQAFEKEPAPTLEIET
ncbi:MAG: response regulator, partial [Pseudomonadales bacterium]|nr:response regulator [Pseudomonadales bacterium]